jgi:hypothetical protein
MISLGAEEKNPIENRLTVSTLRNIVIKSQRLVPLQSRLKSELPHYEIREEMTMKNNTMVLNQLAVKVANGVEGAYEELHGMIKDLLKTHAYKRYSSMEREDLIQEFHLIAYEMCFKFNEKYNDGNTAYMALVYTSCDNFRKNSLISEGREKRSKYSESSLNKAMGAANGEGEKSLEDVASDPTQNSVEDVAVGNVTKEDILDLIEEFSKTAQLRDYEIVKGLANELSSQDISFIVNEHSRKPKKKEDVSYDKSERKAVSRARKAFREFLKTNELFV